MEYRKLHPEHHGPSKPFLCLCLILIIKEITGTFPMLQPHQLPHRSVAQKCETRLRVPPSLWSPRSSTSGDAVPSPFHTERHQMWRCREGGGPGAVLSRRLSLFMRHPNRSCSRRHIDLAMVSRHLSCPVMNSAQQNELSWCKRAGIHPSQAPPGWFSGVRSEPSRPWLADFLIPYSMADLGQQRENENSRCNTLNVRLPPQLNSWFWKHKAHL